MALADFLTVRATDASGGLTVYVPAEHVAEFLATVDPA